MESPFFQEVVKMKRNKKMIMILDIYKEENTTFLESTDILGGLRKQGVNLSKSGLSNFVRNSLQHRYLVPDKDSIGTIIGWKLIQK